MMATKFPATMMVLGFVSNEGDEMPPTFFAKGLANPESVLYLYTSFCLLLLSSLQPVMRFGNEE
jgi:hypothetical protein